VILRALLPDAAFQGLARFLGGHKSMETWRGR
jgi:hypothetical protein